VPKSHVSPLHVGFAAGESASRLALLRCLIGTGGGSNSALNLPIRFGPDDNVDAPLGI